MPTCWFSGTDDAHREIMWYHKHLKQTEPSFERGNGRPVDLLLEDLFSIGGGVLNEAAHLSLKQTYTECHSQVTSFPTTKENIVKEFHKYI